MQAAIFAAVTPLALPQYFTVASPFGNLAAITRNPFTVAGGTIAADITNDTSPWPRIAVWRNGKLLKLPPLPHDSRFPGGPPALLELGALAPGGALIAMRGQPFSGAYSGIAFSALQLTGNSWQPVDTGGCRVGYSVGHVEEIEADGTLDVTYESPDLIDFDDVASGIYAPYAARVKDGRCEILGRFNARDVNGRFAVGFRGYLNGELAPTNANVAQQRFVAIRYEAGKIVELGPGEAFSVAADGTAVGSDAPTLYSRFEVGDSTGSHVYECCMPHAMLWSSNGRIVPLAPQAPQSAAYAIDARHRVIGTLLGRDGRHYAFLWQNGKLHLLDELVHAPGWRLEGAYRFLADGAIVGIGTYEGVSTAFVASVPRDPPSPAGRATFRTSSGF